jgi:hypothetical protein
MHFRRRWIRGGSTALELVCVIAKNAVVDTVSAKEICIFLQLIIGSLNQEYMGEV